ncbi:MAG TPA: 2-dehydropantoate 2-reductase N-terminal domain-containing protein [Myxococcales bacterium]|jgi:2-dehydropantoate 2-reductase
MKILMFGRGVISVLYGWALEKAGHSVEFYVRPGRAAQYGPAVALEFLDARRSLGGAQVKERWPVRLREDLPADHDYGLILLSVQHYRFEEAAAFLSPRVAKATVLAFNNFWVEPQQAASGFPAEQLAWGFPQAGGGFGADGVLRGALFGKVFFGTFLTDPGPRELAAREVFTKAGFGIVEQRDFRSWLFVHFALNCSMQLEALKAGSMPRAFASGRHRQDTILNLRELVPLLAARAVDLKDQSSYLAPFRLPTWLLGPAMGIAPKLLAPLRVVLDSHANMEELRSTCRDVLAEARRLHVAVPRLEAAASLFS